MQTPFWKPNIYARHAAHRAARRTIVRTIRRFFERRGFAEVDTPALQISPGLETHLRAFRAEGYLLHTSPEFAMKKLIVAGMPRIFQLAHAYRNEPKSDTHHPEFTMLEWYRAQTDYRAMMRDTIALVRACARACGVAELRHRSRTCDPFRPWRKLTIAQAFRQYAGVDVMRSLPDENNALPDPGPLRAQAEKIGISCADSDTWEDVFFRIMLNKVECHLGDGVPTILYEYPACLGALARRKPGNPRVVERFEAYACGLELCNAFSELTDADEQAARFAHEIAQKKKLYGETYPMDEDFLAALRYGMPPCSGNAVGADRLVMLISGAEKIEDTL
ncbi:MAG: EF-P lysine aminoacylase EpmA, partial [Alphaproteobacteria bacterium]|nr:EF-P lysine aminoacylase EpmA [Alphaproteobacteria bacterium]